MNRMPALLCILAAIALLAGCAQPTSAPAEAPTTEVPPEPTVETTDIPPPTATTEPTPEPTPTETPWIFRDDFDGGLADGWTRVNEEPDRVSFTADGWLELVAGNPSIGGQEGLDIKMVNALTRPIPEGDFAATVRVKAAPLQNFQQATLFLILDARSYVAINTGFCEFCLPDTGGSGFYGEGFSNGTTLTDPPVFIPRDVTATDVYLRLVYRPAEASVTLYYATAPDAWQEARTLTNVPAFTMVGLGAGNLPGPGSDGTELVAQFDYFELSEVDGS